MTKAPKTETANARWAVHLFRKRGERIGTVEAKGQDEALRKAIEDFERREPIGCG